MKTVFMLVGLLLLSASIQSQVQVDSILTKHPNIQVSSMSFTDSLFLRIKYPDLYKYEYFWLPKNGTHQEVNLKELDQETIFAIAKSKGSVIYYYLSKNSKRIELSYLQVLDDGSKSISKSPIAIDGRFIGSYLDQTLHVLTFNKKEKFFLTETEISNGKTVKENNYPLPINLSDVKRIAFISEENHLSPLKASTPLKIYNRKNELVIISDDPFNGNDEADLQKNFFLSSFTRIDKTTGKSTTQTKFEKRRGYFRTYLWKEYLIRLTLEDNNNGIELATFTLSDLKQKTIQHLGFDKIKDIVRDELQVYKYEDKEMKLLGAPFILFDSLDNQLVLTIGKFWVNSSNHTILAPAAFGVAGALTALLANIAILELNDGGGEMVRIYTYLSGDLQSDFTKLKGDGYIRKKIDDFEIEKTHQEKFFRYKGYTRFNSKILGFYKEKNKKSQYLKILAF